MYINRKMLTEAVQTNVQFPRITRYNLCLLNENEQVLNYSIAIQQQQKNVTN